MKQSEVQKELERFRDYVIKEARTNLTRNKKNVSKGLYESLKGNVKAMPNSLSIEFEMNQYGQFQDKGVKGAKPSLVKNGKQKAPNRFTWALPWKQSRKKRMLSPNWNAKTLIWSC